MSVIIEIPTNDKTEWGVSFTSHNPEPHDYVECASYKDAERLHVYLLGINEQTAIRESELSASKAREAELRERLEAAEAQRDRFKDDANRFYGQAVLNQQRAEAAEADRVREVDFKNAELAKLRDKKFAKFNNEDCWIFQDDGADELQSLVCPVIVQPARLIELLAAEARIKELEAQLTTGRCCNSSG